MGNIIDLTGYRYARQAKKQGSHTYDALMYQLGKSVKKTTTNKTRLDLAYEYIAKANIVGLDKWMQPFCRDAFLAGWEGREEEVKKLKEELAMIRAELREIGNE